MSLDEKEIYFYKDLPINIINKNREFYKGYINLFLIQIYFN
jgi:hypothetical protein